MSEFIVSARKYRPTTFDLVVGQPSITTTLKNAVKNNLLAHAYLFCGPRGVGKTTCARIFAKTINCLHVTKSFEACNKCESCLSFNESRSYNIHELDAASNNTVDDIRNLIDQVRIPPQVGKYSLYIIDEVHMLSTQAFNAFLKTLEEPPAHAIFILATTEKHKIIPTILSRCQIFDFNRIKIEDISHYLEKVAESEKINAEADALTVIAQKADGSMRDALSIFDQIVSFAGTTLTYKDVINNLNILDYVYYYELTDAFINGDYSTSLLKFNEILEDGFDAHHFIAGLSQYFRDLLVCKDAVTLQLLEAGANIREAYKQQSTKVTAGFLFNALNICSHCDLNYKSAINKRLHVELTMLQLCNITSAPKNKPEEKVQKEPAKETTVKKTEPEPVKKVNISAEKGHEKKDTPISEYQKTPSIKSTIKAPVVKEAGPKAEEKKVAETVEPAGEKSITQDNLNEKWNKYTESIKENEPRLYNTLSLHKPLLIDENKIEITVNNPSQAEAIKGIKVALMKFLKKELGNSKLELTTVVTEIVTEKKLYTDEEKFRHLNEQNPNLNKLRQQFKLDFTP